MHGFHKGFTLPATRTDSEARTSAAGPARARTPIPAVMDGPFKFKCGGSPQLYYHDCSGLKSQVTPQGRHR